VRALGVEPEPPEPAVASRVPEGPQPASPEPARTEVLRRIGKVPEHDGPALLLAGLLASPAFQWH